MVLTDYEHKVLLNLQACAAANVATLAHRSPAVARDSGSESLDGESQAAAGASNFKATEGLEAACPQWDLVSIAWCLIQFSLSDQKLEIKK